ncbi:Deoxyribonuclease-2-like protein [Dinothrombium tinctorium]|uniref:Deoxyribonuclease-2-like protein n=1 Tax=Dinothrombium tinctorium TaxID=1965070 RepID=A0A443QNP2_9ACAR|nr:Deoxyribonuclease-2-like protein [Dinothrombium tinctorium]RWS12384.1 Deoxyribonuclease-2-like protein [Dinothrombium tinctorium]
MLVQVITFLICFLFTFFADTFADIYCKDESGRNVDWYFLYKLPRIGNKDEFFSSGLRYAFITGKPISSKNGGTEGWIISSRTVADSNSMLALTLNPVYSDRTKYTYLMYNDHPPRANVTDSYWAHAKGILVMDSKAGFWLSHSIPNFPPRFEEKYDYPDTASINGQTALCVSFKTQSEANIILNHLLTLRPNIYYDSVKKGAPKDDRIIKDLIGKKKPNDAFAQFKFSSYKGDAFQTFSKNSKANGDLYSAFIAPNLKSELIVQTWRRGGGTILPSECNSTFQVRNVNQLNIHSNNSKISHTGVWDYIKDHSKWAISSSAKLPVVCIADINRMRSQFKRGGGAACILNEMAWKAFKQSVVGIENC